MLYSLLSLATCICSYVARDPLLYEEHIKANLFGPNLCYEYTRCLTKVYIESCPITTCVLVC